jgi:AcrR family transcriptional regulator
MKTFEGQEDLRVRRTHKLLWEALMVELSVRPFEKITIKDICERAMVHRTTFYKHYEDKYALLEQGVRQMYAILIAEVNALPNTFSVDDPTPTFIHLFAHAANHQHFYKLMLSGEGIGKFQELIRGFIVKDMESKMTALGSANSPFAVPPAMYAQFFAGAFLSICAWWLENDMPLSPEQMAQYFLFLHNPLFPIHS